ncbi:MAG: hypothetical protein DMG26_17015 [Acidobacteria bacterium]|nr:MAG: hypothetical protein DMG26_17015 [Acidobacteriota bacterium]
MSDNLSFVLMAFIFGGGFVLIVRSLLDYRRTAVLVRVQADAHVKLMEKLASSQELLGYMETEAGKHFLQLVTVGVESSRGPKFPLGRILWPVQVGLVLLLAGAGGFRPLHRVGGGVTRCMLDEWRIHRKRARRMRHPRTEDLTNETLV